MSFGGIKCPAFRPPFTARSWLAALECSLTPFRADCIGFAFVRIYTCRRRSALLRARPEIRVYPVGCVRGEGKIASFRNFGAVGREFAYRRAKSRRGVAEFAPKAAVARERNDEAETSVCPTCRLLFSQPRLSTLLPNAFVRSSSR